MHGNRSWHAFNIRTSDKMTLQTMTVKTDGEFMRKALVIGIDEYARAPLSGCVNDARDIAALLERNGDGSVNFSVRYETNVGTKADLKGMIGECFSGSADVELFYFSGHGFIDALGGYIVTPDYQLNDMGVSMRDILDLVNKSKCQSRIVILDCCHAGYMGNQPAGNSDATVIQDGVTVLTASKSDEYSAEVNGHGVFTSLLIDALNGGAADVTGHITPGGIYAFIDKALGPWEQRPVFKTNVTRFTPVRTVQPLVGIKTLRRLTEYFPAPQSQIQLDPSFEPTNNPEVEHFVKEPYANPANIKIFNDLQKLEGVGLVVPLHEEHMYFAAMNSQACCLTSFGQHYWQLVKNKSI